MNRARELGAFLRSRRDAITPEQAGIRDKPRRHVPGLRREEVAARAEIGTSWYAMLEQGRVDRVGRTTLDRIARALQLTAVERAYMFALAGEAAGPAAGATAVLVSDALQRYVRGIDSAVAFLTGSKSDVVAWNALADRWFGFASLEPPARILLAMMVREPNMRRTFPAWKATLEHMVAVYRHQAIVLRDSSAEALAAELVRESSEFAAAWNAHSVDVPREHRCVLRDGGGEAAYDFHAFAPLDAATQTLIVLSPVAAD